MAISSGTHLGTYEILGPLGAGGMGEVYRARDAKLGRDVAIKVLPEDFAKDPERVARFQREAQVLASLNHSNIGAIYDLQKAADTQFLILELVEGETLAENLTHGPLTPFEAIETAKQIADALESAHEKGIVHRDLKPANIKITRDGKVKVLDFGLAKIYEAEPSDTSLSHSPTLMSARTAGGVILGTVSYMSPEQARGRTVTKQTDIWAFGCVLFEMLTGHLAFSAETVSDTIAKILKEEPDWSSAAAVPASLRRIVDRCLSKDSRRRFHDIADVRVELEDALTPVAPPSLAPSRLTHLNVFAAIILISIIVGVVAGIWPRAAGPAPAWTGTLLGPAVAFGPRLSPDGKFLGFITLVEGQAQVAVMNPKSGDWTVLTHQKNAGIVDHLSWSRDGTKIYFERHMGAPLGVYSIPALGGEPRLLLEGASGPEALPDGSLIVIRINARRLWQLYRFTPDTGTVQPLDAAPGAVNTRFPVSVFRAFPDGTGVVFYGTSQDPADSRPGLRFLDLQSNRSRPFGPSLPEGLTSFGIGINPADSSVVFNSSVGDLHRVLAIPRNGTGEPQVLLTLTDQSGFVDVAADGSVYVDQVSRPVQVLRLDGSARPPEQLALVTNTQVEVLELPDERFLMTATFEGRSRLVVIKPSGDVVPFIETEQETHGPATLVGANQVAFIIGTASQQAIALASITDGRVQQRIPVGRSVFSLASSPDGNTLFYAAEGSIWSLPVAGGEAKKLGPGDSVAFDAHDQTLVVQLNSEGGVHLVRMPISGGMQEPIFMGTEFRLPPGESHAVRSDGEIALGIASPDSWFYGIGLLDPKGGKIRRIPLPVDEDIFSLSWNAQGKIVTGGALFRSAIWRFRPETAH